MRRAFKRTSAPHKSRLTFIKEQTTQPNGYYTEALIDNNRYF